MERIFTAVFVLLGLAGMAVVWPEEEHILKVERPVFSLDARTAATSGAAFLLDKASLEKQGFHTKTTSPGIPRVIEVLEVLDVNRYRIRSDRGEEEIELLGMGSNDQRLPAEMRTYMREVAIPGIEQLLMEDATEILEFQPNDPSIPLDFQGQSHPARHAARLVSLSVKLPDRSHTNLVLILLARGWSYSDLPLSDSLALGLDFVFGDPPTDNGIFGLDVVERITREAEEGRIRIERWGEEQIQLRGERVLQAFGDWLGWQPEEPIQFHRVSRRVAFRMMLDQYVAWQKEIRERDPNNPFVHIDPRELAGSFMETTDACSPSGPHIYFYGWDLVNERAVDAILAHEIAHHFQEELLVSRASHWPMDYSDDFLEGHAEALSAAWMRSRFEDCAGYYGSHHTKWVRNIEEICASFGTTVRGFRFDPLWRVEYGLTEPFGTLEEWSFVNSEMESVGGLAFKILEVRDDVVEVSVENLTDEEFSAQFTGKWWVRKEPTPYTGGWLRGFLHCPFNLVVGPRQTVRLTMPTRARALIGATELHGVFSRTWGFRGT